MTRTFMIAAAAVAMAAGASAAEQAKGAPDLQVVQAAYDAAAADSKDKHTIGLKIVGVDCERVSGEESLSCQVGFKLPDQQDDRVYLDVAAVVRQPDGSWKLTSGLCRRTI